MITTPAAEASQNSAPSMVYFWGTYTGGVLSVEEPRGVRTLRERGTWHSFDGRFYHRLSPVTSGVRYSMVLFDRP